MEDQIEAPGNEGAIIVVAATPPERAARLPWTEPRLRVLTGFSDAAYGSVFPNSDGYAFLVS